MSDDAAIRRKLRALATALRQFHSALLDKAREDHEFMHGPVRSPYEMFNLVTSHPNFQWLRPLSGLMATLDEVLDTKDLTLTGQQVRDVRQALDVLFSQTEPAFAEFRKGYDAAKERPAVAQADARWREVRDSLSSLSA
ncbi:hypothetical protein Deipr_0223 [Deinococcus proteolyticus MRP]|uniref:Uncharacterized protein n=1 Tax=Deinococcus proteolyticus (strain ATCC 35074 / DSM 20540 / JCM 6276 / NBRC 101906 / NCIMB 13154 / VKM Ac-1939 / CCM 2703 / MRP) TaxID=693977 RepID=F0RIY8_DEIPM|nr:hypothetical protein [Deinococcus proteolyticus]ADY25396.1 hypothetical protein Deipr_0223 [Deinococcus proteolyticus MRP]